MTKTKEFDITDWCGASQDSIVDINNWYGMTAYLSQETGIAVEKLDEAEVVNEETVVERAVLKNKYYNRNSDLLYTGKTIFDYKVDDTTELKLVARFDRQEAGEFDDTWLYEEAMENSDTVANYNALMDELKAKNFKLLKDGEVLEVNEKNLDDAWVSMGAERVDLDYNIKEGYLDIQVNQWLGEYEVIDEELAEFYEEA